MIAIYAEKPDMGTKIAAALFGIPLENGVVVTFSQLEKYERQIEAKALMKMRSPRRKALLRDYL